MFKAKTRDLLRGCDMGDDWIRVETGCSYNDIDCYGELWERNSVWLADPDTPIASWHLPFVRRLGYGYSVCDLGRVEIRSEHVARLAEQLAEAMPEGTQRGAKFKLLQMHDVHTPLACQQAAQSTMLVVWDNADSEHLVRHAQGMTFGELCASRQYTDHMLSSVTRRTQLAARVLQAVDIRPENNVLSADRSRLYTYQDVNTCHLQPMNGQICAVSDYHLSSQACALVDHGCHTGCTMVVCREAHQNASSMDGAPATDPLHCPETHTEGIMQRFDELVQDRNLPSHVSVGAHPANRTRLLPVDATAAERHPTLMSNYLHHFNPADVLVCTVVAAAYPSPLCQDKLYGTRELDIRGALRHRHPAETHLRIPQTPHWINLLMQTFTGSRLFELMNKENARTHPDDPETVLGYDIPIDKVE